MSNLWIAAAISVSNNDAGDTATLQAAMLADTAHQAITILQRRLDETGKRIRRVEVVMPAEQWVHDYPHEWDAIGLARQVRPDFPVAILLTQAALATQSARPEWLKIEASRQVTLLDRQHGQRIRKAMPEEVADQLFRPGSETYAVLDGTAIPMLPERLEASELDHICLFRDATSVSERDNAPWLVRLTTDAHFTRRLFTISGNPNDLGDRQYGIFLQSRQSLHDVQSHLRYFTRLRDENGKWFYFRFWSGSHLFALLEATVQGRLDGFGRFFRSRHAQLDAVAHLGREGVWQFAHRIADAPMVSSPLVLTNLMRRELRAPQRSAFLVRLKAHLADQQLGTLSDNELLILLERAKQSGFTLEKAVADYAEATLRAGRPPETILVKTGGVAKLHQLDRASQMLKYAKTINRSVT